VSRIKTICPVDHGGCGREHWVDAPDDLDEDGRAYALRFAAMTGCRPCSIYQASKFKLENVRNSNQATIWDQERRRDHYRQVIAGDPRNKAELEAKVIDHERNISTARSDLVLSIRELDRLNDARVEQLQELQLA
jgi:ribosome-binding protein aMBF1 (putative translation factor)